MIGGPIYLGNPIDYNAIELVLICQIVNILQIVQATRGRRNCDFAPTTTIA